MPKRTNPFGDSSPLQFKTRIGKKEVDLGVCAEENMQSVYAKTKSMMFEAARQGTDMATSVTMETSESDPIPPPQPTVGQLRIDSTGRLCSKGHDHSVPGGLMGIKGIQGFFGSVGETVLLTPVSANQMTLDHQGCLTMANKAKPNPFQSIASQRFQCHSCRVTSQTLKGCSFCDKQTCSGCMQQCEGCQGDFCHVCSVLNYDDCMERAYCLQCSS